MHPNITLEAVFEQDTAGRSSKPTYEARECDLVENEAINRRADDPAVLSWLLRMQFMSKCHVKGVVRTGIIVALLRAHIRCEREQFG